MLLMTRKAGLAEPTLCCSVCERPITSGREASVVYPSHIDEGSVHRVLLAHNRRCLHVAEERLIDEHGPPARMSLISYLARFVGAEPMGELRVPERRRASESPGGHLPRG